MYTIKLFLASSSELKADRDAIGNLVRQLDGIFEKRGIRIKLFEWEDYDSAYNGVRKQDEYNEAIKESDMFLALFHRKVGEYTLEEFEVAVDSFRLNGKPKVYAFIRDLAPGEVESADLASFKERLSKELGHYWCGYGNIDTLKLEVIKQLLLVDSLKSVKLEVKRGSVMTEGVHVADMDNLAFAARNEEYRALSEELQSLPGKIDKARARLAKFPDDEDLIDDLQQKLDRYNAQKAVFERLQKEMLETSRQISVLQQGQVSDQLRRAIEAFEEGDVKKANLLLEEIAREAEDHLARLDEDRALIHQDIDAALLQARTVLADASISLIDRVERARAIYRRADDWAQKSAYPDEKYGDLLLTYGVILHYLKSYDDAIKTYHRSLDMKMELHGEENPIIATCYSSIAAVYFDSFDYPHALQYHLKAMEINKRVLGEDAAETASSYEDLGCVYSELGKYNIALDYSQKALLILEKLYGEEHPDTEIAYNDVGVSFMHLMDYPRALEYCSKSLKISRKLFGDESSEAARGYNNVATVYEKQGNHTQALEYFKKALGVLKKTLGEEHLNTAKAYGNIGAIYCQLGKTEPALEFFHHALKIYSKLYDRETPYVAEIFNHLGGLYEKNNDMARALEYYHKALDIALNVLGENHFVVAEICWNIGNLYDSMGDYAHSTGYLLKSLRIKEKELGKDHPDVSRICFHLGKGYYYLGRYIEAYDFCTRANKALGPTLDLETLSLLGKWIADSAVHLGLKS